MNITRVQDFYERVIHRVRSGRFLTFTFRCDAPALRRLLEMKVEPLGTGRVAFQTRTISVIDRPPVVLLQSSVNGHQSSETVQMCAWCQRVRMTHWTELEDVQISSTMPVPRVEYGMCEDDEHRFRVLLE